MDVEVVEPLRALAAVVDQLVAEGLPVDGAVLAGLSAQLAVGVCGRAWRSGLRRVVGVA